MAVNTQQFKELLQTEQTSIEKQLGTVGRINPENPSDWQATAGDTNIDTAEEEERASGISEYENRSAMEFELERRLNEIQNALERIDTDTYGICVICNKEIEEDRLLANPAAETCKADRDKDPVDPTLV